MMIDGTKKKVLGRLRRIRGQVEGIARMVEADRYCVELLLQLASVQAAVSQVSKLTLRSHVETCVAEAMASNRAGERKHKMDELLEVFARYGCLHGRSLGGAGTANRRT